MSDANASDAVTPSDIHASVDGVFKFSRNMELTGRTP